MYLEANVASCKRSSKIYFQALARSMVVYWTVAIIFNKLNAINNIILLLMIIILIIILLINSNNYNTYQAYHVLIFIHTNHQSS